MTKRSRVYKVKNDIREELSAMAAQLGYIVGGHDMLFTVFDEHHVGIRINNCLRNNAKTVRAWLQDKMISKEVVSPGTKVDLTGLLPSERDAVVMQMMNGSRLEFKGPKPEEPFKVIEIESAIS